MISVILPTLTGREMHLETVAAAYRSASEAVEIIVIRDLPAWGEALNAGVEQATGDRLMLGCDDMMPAYGWEIGASEAVARGVLPAPTIRMPSGDVYLGPRQSPTGKPLCVLPFCSREQWDEIGPMLNTHYFADNAFTDRAQALGYSIEYPASFRFRHLMAPGDNTVERREHDIEIYNAAIRFAGIVPSLPMPHLGE